MSQIGSNVFLRDDCVIVTKARLAELEAHAPPPPKIGLPKPLKPAATSKKPKPKPRMFSGDRT